MFVAVYLIEAGLILMAAPWTDWWRFNYFADVLPGLRTLMSTSGMRAGVLVVGIVTAAVGVSDLWQALAERYGNRPHPSDAADS